jgi:6-pyruvoyltetrahydropterin/6-carboxytetrahydropterin synthase
MYEVGLQQGFRAWHVMPDMEGPEGEFHSHDYRLEVVITRSELDDKGMVCDIDVVEAALRATVDEIADRNLDVIQPPDAYAVTVEVLARWAHSNLAGGLPNDPAQTLHVRVWESPVAFGGYSAPLSIPS